MYGKCVWTLGAKRGAAPGQFTGSACQRMTGWEQCSLASCASPRADQSARQQGREQGAGQQRITGSGWLPFSLFLPFSLLLSALTLMEDEAAQEAPLREEEASPAALGPVAAA